jgi:hypothetical protein
MFSMSTSVRNSQLNKVLALCGPLAAAAFLAADIMGILKTPNYSVVGQAISELMEREAPAKAFVDPLLLAYHGLVVRASIAVCPAADLFMQGRFSLGWLAHWTLC